MGCLSYFWPLAASYNPYLKCSFQVFSLNYELCLLQNVQLEKIVTSKSIQSFLIHQDQIVFVRQMKHADERLRDETRIELSRKCIRRVLREQLRKFILLMILIDVVLGLILTGRDHGDTAYFDRVDSIHESFLELADIKIRSVADLNQLILLII